MELCIILGPTYTLQVAHCLEMEFLNFQPWLVFTPGTSHTSCSLQIILLWFVIVHRELSQGFVLKYDCSVMEVCLDHVFPTLTDYSFHDRQSIAHSLVPSHHFWKEKDFCKTSYLPFSAVQWHSPSCGWRWILPAVKSLPCHPVDKTCHLLSAVVQNCGTPNNSCPTSVWRVQWWRYSDASA